MLGEFYARLHTKIHEINLDEKAQELCDRAIFGLFHAILICYANSPKGNSSTQSNSDEIVFTLFNNLIKFSIFTLFSKAEKFWDSLLLISLKL